MHTIPRAEAPPVEATGVGNHRFRIGDPTTLSDLVRRVTGSVTTPADPEYDAVVQCWNRTMLHRPQVVVRAADVRDVVATVSFARSNGLGLGVQATGHGAVLPVEGVLLVTSGLDTLEVDPVRRTARIGAGVTWGPVLAAAAVHGLTPLLGSSPNVGAVGYTLGGGLGWLSRSHGASCDRMLEAEIVLPDGRLVRCAPDERPELFRALCGGGGGALGVVTSIVVELVEVDEVYAGNLLYPATAAAEVAAAWAPWADAAPDALTSALVHINFPPAPDVPEPLRGGSFSIVRGCWSGDVEAGRRYVDRLRSEIPPIADMWGPMRFAASARISNDPVDPLPCVTTGGWLDRFGASEAATLAAATFGGDGRPQLLLSEIRNVGGWSSAGRRRRSVMANRTGRFLFHAIGVPATAGAEAAIEEHLARLRDDLTTATNPAAFLNFIDGAERRRRSIDAINPSERADLGHVHRWYDPDSTLRYGVSAPV